MRVCEDGSIEFAFDEEVEIPIENFSDGHVDISEGNPNYSIFYGFMDDEE